MFCSNCGTEMVNGVCPKCSKAQAAPRQNGRFADANDKYKDFFISPDEKFVCALGNGYFKNFLAGGSLKKGFAVISDKRVYFRGRAFDINLKKMKIKTVSSNVDLKDVTGTEVQHINPTAYLLVGLLAFVMFLGMFFSIGKNPVTSLVGIASFAIAIIFISSYFSRKCTLLKIMFGGGGIAFDLKWFPAEEGANFQKMLRIAKDKVVNEAENATAKAVRQALMHSSSQPQTAASPADELVKYAQLYKDGLISEQEYNDFKAKLLKG